MTRYMLVCLIVAGLSLHAATAGAKSGITTTDTVMAAVPITALAVAFFKDDTEGEKQWLRNLAVNQILTSVLRVGFNETSLGERPNGKGYGFPSGHVAAAMSGATFLGERYGWKWGLPAYLAGAYVAYDRVDSDHHHWRDVIAATVLSYGVAKLTVTPKNATYLAPIVGPNFLGLRWGRSF
jgi:membrane-associated phospholipid phosphatase